MGFVRVDSDHNIRMRVKEANALSEKEKQGSVLDFSKHYCFTKGINFFLTKYTIARNAFTRDMTPKMKLTRD